MSELEPQTETPEPDPTPEPDTPETPEPENPDAEPEPEPEHIDGPDAPPAPEPAVPQLTDKEREQQQKNLDREAKRHSEKVESLLGAETDSIIVCPFCDPQLQGYLWEESLQHPRDEMQAALFGALTAPPHPEYQDAPHAHRCQDCDGYGVVNSGSRKPGNETISCPTCRALGYITDPRFSVNGTTEQDASLSLVPAGGGEQVIEDTDAWGSPRLLGDGQENPNYGKMPQYKNPTLP